MRPACKIQDVPDCRLRRKIPKPVDVSLREMQRRDDEQLVGLLRLEVGGYSDSAVFLPRIINVTDNAVRQLRSLLAADAENSRKGLRVQIAKGGCSGLQYEMTLDEKKDGDAVVERDGMQFLVDDKSIPYLRGATLDFRDGLTGAGFHIVNPNASRTCGCGSSFETPRPA